MPSTTNLEEEEIVDAPGNDGNASMPEQVSRPKPWRKMMMMMMMMTTFSLYKLNREKVNKNVSYVECLPGQHNWGCAGLLMRNFAQEK